MAEIKKHSAAEPIADVAHPGKTAPSPNSKSVIVGHKATLANDPMVKEPTDTPSIDTSPETPAIKSSTGGSSSKTIQPLATSPEPVPELKIDLPVATEDEPKAEAEAEPEPKPEETAEPATNDAQVGPGTEPKQTDDIKDPTELKADIEASKEAEHAEAVEKMAESRKYFLPIETVEKRRSKRFIAMGVLLSLLLVVGWADIALDAGLVAVQSNTPHSHFFTIAPTVAAAPVSNLKLIKASCGHVKDTDKGADPFKACFNKHFAACTPAQIVVDENATASFSLKGSIFEFSIKDKTAAGCNVEYQFARYPINPKWVNKTATCPYDNTKDFATQFLAKTDFTDCSGPLATLEQAHAQSSAGATTDDPLSGITIPPDATVTKTIDANGNHITTVTETDGSVSTYNTGN